ncbi:DUF4189 domain-containing protein [Kitasatospora sp. NPDC088783]|uniref:DUF4189 domain-containing protein n=1 Tax=Kitasatospora sp. NPDC088783 TaxID=3364077 RepID=UPI0038053D39
MAADPIPVNGSAGELPPHPRRPRPDPPRPDPPRRGGGGGGGGAGGVIALILLAVVGIGVATENRDPDRPTPGPTSTAPAAASHFVLPAPPLLTHSYDPPSLPDTEPVDVDPPVVDPPSVDPPVVDPPSPPPPPVRYGAIAVDGKGGTGRAWNYPSAEAAQQRAMSECPGTDCKVLTAFSDGCGAVAYNPTARHYWGGHGKTRAEAQQAAIANAGGGTWIAWVCTG